MFLSLHRTYMPVLILLIFGLQVIFSSPESCAQGLMRTADVPGGGGSTTQTQSTTDDGTTLIIVGAAIIAGILVYTLVINKDKPKKEEKQDSTSNGSSLLNSPEKILSAEKYRNSELVPVLPVNFYLGFQNSDKTLREKKFIMGISCNF